LSVTEPGYECPVGLSMIDQEARDLGLSHVCKSGLSACSWWLCLNMITEALKVITQGTLTMAQGKLESWEMPFMTIKWLVHGTSKGWQMICHHKHTGGNGNQKWGNYSVHSTLDSFPSYSLNSIFPDIAKGTKYSKVTDRWPGQTCQEISKFSLSLAFRPFFSQSFPSEASVWLLRGPMGHRFLRG
jgi:hypothetical protein